ncbi:MAG: SLC13 family permease [Gemmatimonadales bacterium]
MSADGWITIAVVGFTVLGLAATRIPADLVFAAALTLLLLTGVLSPNEAFAGLGNPGLVTVAVLYVVVSGLVQTGAAYAIGARLLGRPETERLARLRLIVPVASLSAFLNNTPVVAMMVPVVEEWSRRIRIPVSKLMIPLSYAAILGGTCTLIGTSTNLVVNGLVLERTSLGSFGFFDIAALGLPAAILGTAYLVVVGRWLLPDREAPFASPAAVREYTIELLLEPSSPLVGKTVEAAGLRSLPGAFLAEIERADTILPAVPPTEQLQAGDRLLFVGAVDSMADLMRVRGLVPVPDQLDKLSVPRPERSLVEVVVSESCPAVRRTIRAGRFRTLYDAVVLAVARDGQRLPGKVGDITLRVGDTLLLETRPSFLEQHRNSRDFLLVSEVRGHAVPRHDRAWIAALVLGGMVVAAATGLLSMLEAALVAAGLMIVTRCTTGSDARASVDWSVLVVIGAALGLGQAMDASGAAAAIAAWWLGLAGGSPWLALAAVYVLTAGFTELITNNAAAVLVFPVAQATAAGLGVSLWPFVAVLMMAASASFATPIGYQTNLMVYGPGGYRFSDYLRIGLPLNLLVGTLTVLLAPLIWPF